MELASPCSRPFCLLYGKLLSYFICVTSCIWWCFLPACESLQAIAILTGCHLGEPEWKELMDDGMSWTSPVLTIIVGSFLYNLVKYRNSSPPSSTSQAIRLSRSPGNSPRQALFGSFHLPTEVKEGEDEDEARLKGIKLEIWAENFRFNASERNVDIAIATKGDEAFDWVEMPKVHRKNRKDGESWYQPLNISVWLFSRANPKK